MGSRVDKNKERKRKNKIRLITCFTILGIILFLCSFSNFKEYACLDNNSKTNEENNKIIDGENIKKISISAVGDCTFGNYKGSNWTNSFNHEFENQKSDFAYFFENVKKFFSKDDITIINLEGPLTNAYKSEDKKFAFKGKPSYVNILKQGSIEAVNIANNHTYDYLEKGYKNTIDILKDNGIGYFGYENKYIKDVKGIKVGILGYKVWNNSNYLKRQIKNDLEYMKLNSNLIIVNFHWGEENKYYPNNIQKNIGHYAIDNGADLVLGHHPHVIQGIEKYKDKYIVYSLGNFCFGGNRNPSDKDTFIFQQTFTFENNELVNSSKNIIPCSISSIKSRNDYKPTPLTGEEKARVLNKIDNLSEFY
ncbi:CapA family protein [Tepidibacter formicigenes]|jgi:poly-gamma-glutamate synthesis protein (capsule biosynthesis protein)|uniref:Poly-gamma-glutamate synthesis protein (Capsule biosynthesis protein) n=1 Tax=Tepidibacter formicigenes DSM 15518 TaxID=1123349 RepID=A0A1M6TBH5_9FIRM|nr:CapA family protein [Tepidibacter formicigenes]SHK54229.1 poly-gamma-glutamate synthesis protein (capsule biosynthesis protein) [Tepidibacter formicigenes DSM 15518]